MVRKTTITLAVWMLVVSFYYIFILVKITHKITFVLSCSEEHNRETYSWFKMVVLSKKSKNIKGRLEKINRIRNVYVICIGLLYVCSKKITHKKTHLCYLAYWWRKVNVFMRKMILWNEKSKNMRNG